MKEKLKKINIMKKICPGQKQLGQQHVKQKKFTNNGFVGGWWWFGKRQYFEYVETHDENNYYTLTCAFNVMRDMF